MKGKEMEEFEDDEEDNEVVEELTADQKERLRIAKLELRLAKIEKAIVVNQKYITEQHSAIGELQDNFKLYIESK